MFQIPCIQPKVYPKQYMFGVLYDVDTNKWRIAKHPAGDIQESNGVIRKATMDFDATGLVTSIENEQLEAQLIRALNTILEAA